MAEPDDLAADYYRYWAKTTRVTDAAPCHLLPWHSLDVAAVGVVLLDPDAGESRSLTAGAFDDADPAWSAEGDRAVFVSSRPEHPDAG